eukprot:c339_g2_i1.p1 GENE.c339_g2_i1~~c339_g2_i1.p1  ORF type:complete len:315 (+),score=125.99 c339_g2_i1:123-1067(+)
MFGISLNNLRYPMIAYFGILHILSFYSFSYFSEANWKTLFFAFFLHFLGCFGITAGAHRLWSHRSYKALLPTRFMLMFFSTIANQGSLYEWCLDHRVHHKRCDTDCDPHNSNRGLFYSHVGWLLVKPHPKYLEALKEMDDSDLLADPIIRMQLMVYPWCNLFMCFIFPAIISNLCWDESFWVAFLIAGVLKNVSTLHSTWAVNSFAHALGSRPYHPFINPTENLGVAIAAFGEGWHNWHHKFPFDYACAEFGVTQRYNPTKLIIDFLASINQVSDRKTAVHLWKSEQSKKLSSKTSQEINDKTQSQELNSSFGG